MSHLSSQNKADLVTNQIDDITAFGDASVAMFLTDKGGICLNVNQMFIGLVRHTRKQLVGQPLTSLLTLSAQDEVATHYATFVNSDTVHCSQTWQLAEGGSFTIMTSRLADSKRFLNVVTQVTSAEVQPVTEQPVSDDLPILAEPRVQDRVHLRALYNAIPDGVLRFDRQGICLEVKAPESFTSFTTHIDIVGKPVGVNLPSADVEQVQVAIDRLFATSEIQTFEYSLEIDGELQYCENRFVRLSDREGIALVRDITERKKAETLLATWKQRYDLIVASSGQVVYEHDIATGDIIWSGSIYDVLGFRIEDMTGGIARCLELMHPDDAPDAVAALNKAITDATPYDVEYRFQNVLGNYINVLDRGFFVTDVDGSAVTMLGMMQDVSGRKQAEAALEAERAYLRALYDAIPDGIIHFDRQGICLAVKAPSMFEPNRDVRKMVGQLSEGKLPLAVAERVKASRDKMFETGQLQHFEYSLEMNGTTYYRENHFVKLNDKEGIAIIRDITERKRREQENQAQKEHLMGLYQALPDAILRVDQAGNYLEFKPPLNFQPSYSTEQAIGRNIRDNVSAEVADLALHYLERLFLTGTLQHYEHSLVLAGEVRYRENRLVKVNNNEALIIVRDITEQKRVETAAKAQQEQLMGLYQAFPDTVIRFNRSGYYLDVKPPSQAGSYYVASEFTGRHIRDNVPATMAGVAMECVEKLFTTDNLQMFEYTVETATTTYYRETRLVKLNRAEGLMIVRDITERKQAEQSINLQQARLAALYDAIPDGIAQVSRDGMIIDIKAPTTYQLYKSVEVSQGISVRDTAPPKVVNVFEAKLEHLFATGEAQKFEYSLDIADQTRYRECRMVKLNDHEALSIVRDVTEQKQAEMDFHEGQARLLALYQGIPDIVTWFKRDGTIVDYTKLHKHNVYNPEAPRIGHNIMSIVPPYMEEMFETSLERLFATEQMQQFDYSIELLGKLHYRECRFILRDDNDVLLMTRDVTEQKQAELVFREGQARLLALYQGIPDAITWFKRDGTIIDYKKPLHHEVYDPTAKRLGRNIRDILPPHIQDLFEASLECLFATKQMQQFDYSLELSGDTCYRECRLILRNDDDVLVMVRDITEQKRNEQNLTAGQARLLALYQGIPDAITWLKRDGTILDLKLSHAHAPYYPVDDVVGHNMREFAPADVVAKLDVALEALFQHEGLQQFDYSLEVDGELRDRECRLIKLNDSEALSMVRDTTEQKRAEAAAQTGQERILALYEGIPDSLTWITREGVILDHKIPLTHQTYKLEETVVGKNIRNFAPESAKDPLENGLRQLFDHGKLQQFDYSFVKDGITFYRECQLVKRNHDEALVIVRDISAYKRVENALRAEKEQVLALYKAIPDGIVRFNQEGIYLDVKPISGQETFKPIADLLGRTFEENLPAENALAARRHSERLFATGEMQQFESRIIIDEQMRHRNIRMVKLNNHEALAIIRDVTQREQIAQHLTNERAHLLALYEAIPDTIIRLSREGQYLSYKPASYFKPYKDPGTTLGGYLRDNAPPNAIETAYKYLARLFETGEMQRFENTLLIDGTLRYRENRLVKLNNNEALSIVRDLTEQKQAEQALRESKQRLDLAIEAAELGIWDRHVDEDVALVNAHYKRIMGIPENADVSYKVMLEDIHPEDLQRTLDDFADLYEGRKRSICHERRQRHADGSYRWLCITGSAVAWDEQGKPVRFVTVVDDIHAQKTLQLQLEQALKEKTVLLAEVHHRVKNNMQIIGSIMSLHAREAKQPEAKAALASSRARIRTMAAIHEVMYNTEVFSDLDFSTYLQTIARSLVQFSYRDTPDHTGQLPELEFKLIPVRLDMQDALPCALIFNELLSNALKHAFPVARATYTSAAPKIYISLNQVGERISLSIRDNGIGVTTTRKNFGSFIVDTLVEQLGGKLELTPAYQDPPEGTQATLTFDKMI